MSDTLSMISRWVDENRDQCIEFFQELIRIPSPSGEEHGVAEYIASKMNEYGYNSANVDALGDVMGTIKGRGDGRSFLLNGHIDHVPVGDMVDPYSAKLMDGAEFGDTGEVLYGRAACDMKGAVAAMVLAGTSPQRTGYQTQRRLQGDRRSLRRSRRRRN